MSRQRGHMETPMKRTMLTFVAGLFSFSAYAHGEHDYDWMNEAPAPEVTEEELSLIHI